MKTMEVIYCYTQIKKVCDGSKLLKQKYLKLFKLPTYDV